MKKSILLILLLSARLVFADVSGTDSLLSRLTLSTYFETYYTYDFGNVGPEKLKGIVNHHKNNEIAINLALVRASYNTDKYRANLGVMIGSYANRNYTSDNNYKYIYESSVGIKLSKKNNLWFDIGIFPSHIGAEGVIGKDNWTLTRSLQAEASPYYEAGAKVSFTSKNEKWFASFLVLNGWQVIDKPDNYPLSIGTQLQYRPNAKILLNSSSYIGNNGLSFFNKIKERYFHNFYAQIQWTEKFGTILGFDIGSQQSMIQDNLYYLWYSPILVARYTLNAKHAFAFRAEYLNDYYQNVFSTNDYFFGTNFGFVGAGFSLNYDWQLNKYAMLRLEGKMYRTDKLIFRENNSILNASNTNNSITTAFIFHLND